MEGKIRICTTMDGVLETVNDLAPAWKKYAVDPTIVIPIVLFMSCKSAMASSAMDIFQADALLEADESVATYDFNVEEIRRSMVAQRVYSALLTVDPIRCFLSGAYVAVVDRQKNGVYPGYLIFQKSQVRFQCADGHDTRMAVKMLANEPGANIHPGEAVAVIISLD